LTTSPSRTRRLLRTQRFMRIFSEGHVSSESTMQTVSRRFLPFSRTVSPRKSISSKQYEGGPALACDRATTELSSLMASSTRSRLGLVLVLRMAVAKSSGLQRAL
ncbi:unnamed protein product, partial [Ixodes hexagonus]